VRGGLRVVGERNPVDARPAPSARPFHDARYGPWAQPSQLVHLVRAEAEMWIKRMIDGNPPRWNERSGSAADDFEIHRVNQLVASRRVSPRDGALLLAVCRLRREYGHAKIAEAVRRMFRRW
jgi:hypothetical protein